jgi:hypothetical protein
MAMDLVSGQTGTPSRPIRDGAPPLLIRGIFLLAALLLRPLPRCHANALASKPRADLLNVLADHPVGGFLFHGRGLIDWRALREHRPRSE